MPQRASDFNPDQVLISGMHSAQRNRKFKCMMHVTQICHSRANACAVNLQDCGHAPAHDLALFDHTLMSQHTPSTPRRVVLAYDERMTLHTEGSSSSHPERPDRIRVVMARLHASGLTDQCQPMPVREATVEEVTACHGADHMVRVAKKAAQAAADLMAGGPGKAYFSSDTYANQHTLLCARLSAGACADVATAVVRSAASTTSICIHCCAHAPWLVPVSHFSSGSCPQLFEAYLSMHSALACGIATANVNLD